MFASGEWVAQKPCVRVTPWPVFSNTQVTMSPFFSVISAFCVFRLPTPELVPGPLNPFCGSVLTVQLYGVLGSDDPPIPVSTHPSGTISVTEYAPAASVWVFDWPPASEKWLYGGSGLVVKLKLVDDPVGLMSFVMMILPGWSSLVIVQVASSPIPSVMFEPLCVPPTQTHALAE